MSPRSITELVLHRPPLLTVDQDVESAVRRLLDADLPALPVTDKDQHFVGIFGEREFMTAIMPGYLGQLRHAAFVSRSLDDALQRRDACRTEAVGRYMNTEHIEVGPDFSDAQVAEIFLHHRVLVVPVIDNGRVKGIVTRRDFFRVIAQRFVGTT